MTICTATVREEFFRVLRHFDVTTIFGNPGSTELPMFRDWPDDFRYVLGLQECVALGMADGFAQARRKPAVVNLHSAAGLGHALGNLFTAYKNQSPVVVVAGQQARSLLPLDPYLGAERATEFPRPYVKWSCEPARARDVPPAIARACHVAMQPPCGPVFVSVPADDWEQPCDRVQLRRVSTQVLGQLNLIAEAAQALRSAHHPALVVGASVARDQAWDEVVALAEHHNARVYASPWSARNSFPEDHRLFAGFLAANRAQIVQALEGHDLILVLGAPVFTYHIDSDGPDAPESAAVYQIVDDPAVASWAPIGTAIVSSLKPAISELLARADLPVSRPPPPARARPDIVDAVRLSEAFLLQRLAALRPAGCVVVEEAPGSRVAMQAHVPMVEPDSFYTCASGGLGHGLPAAVGIALGRPGACVVALLGDGSCMYASQGLWSAAQLKLPIVFIIVRNGCYAALIGFAKLFNVDGHIGTALPNIDFVALAQAHGVSGRRVEDPAHLDQVLLEAFGSGGPVLLEVVVR